MFNNPVLFVSLPGISGAKGIHILFTHFSSSSQFASIVHSRLLLASQLLVSKTQVFVHPKFPPVYPPKSTQLLPPRLSPSQFSPGSKTPFPQLEGIIIQLFVKVSHW